MLILIVHLASGAALVGLWASYNRRFSVLSSLLLDANRRALKAELKARSLSDKFERPRDPVTKRFIKRRTLWATK